MIVPNLLCSISYHFLNIIIIIIIIIFLIIIIIILIFLLSIYFSLGGNGTEPTICQYFKAKFEQHSFL